MISTKYGFAIVIGYQFGFHLGYCCIYGRFILFSISGPFVQSLKVLEFLIYKLVYKMCL